MGFLASQCPKFHQVTSSLVASPRKETPTIILGSPSPQVLSFPGLNALGLSMNRVDYAPGGVNPLHSHPRATEAGVILKGKVLVGFISTTNVFYLKVLKAGEMFVIPKGLVHFQKNVGRGKAVTITSFNSQLPGAAVLPATIFASNPAIPNDVLAKNFQVDETVITSIKSKFGSS
ncbi:hypothetical protein C5167_006336 [Papaver somniferum]|uniref:Germin-like protein n=1 Tax=Papaver somniferum TaxID=3469 RepID=A0A4Y7JH03_PAPSO|nr:hypothetical protein C5167_006336 [Papaver somniferum]